MVVHLLDYAWMHNQCYCTDAFINNFGACGPKDIVFSTEILKMFILVPQTFKNH